MSSTSSPRISCPRLGGGANLKAQLASRRGRGGTFYIVFNNAAPRSITSRSALRLPWRLTAKRYQADRAWRQYARWRVLASGMAGSSSSSSI